MTVYWGQIDPVDPSRFVIPIKYGSGVGEIAGWLDHRGFVNIKVKMR
jgi:hypothetical protein